MATIKPFKAYRPRADLVEQISSVPYDVVNTEEAKELAQGKPDSFLRVVRSEIEFEDGHNAYADEVYQKAKSNLEELISSGKLIQEEEDSLYVYQQQMGENIQTGIVACSAVDEYDSGLVKIHEKTRPVKENDRTRHMVETGAHTGPVFLCYRATEEIKQLVTKEVEKEPLYNFEKNSVRHTLWKADNTSQLQAAFKAVPATYVADGHHRAKSSSRTREEMRSNNPSHTGDESYNFFLSVLFPDDELKILDYNRIIKKTEKSEDQILEEVQKIYDITEASSAKPANRGEVCMFLNSKWYNLKLKTDFQIPKNPVDALDVSILQNNILSPVFGVENPRESENIDFIGGIRGTEELEKLVNTGKACVAFAMYPVSIEELLSVADEDLTMAPKSTWFEPKLLSGLLVHKFN